MAQQAQQNLQLLATNPQELERCLLQLTVPDNAKLKAAYNVLKQFFVQPGSILPTFNLVANSQNPSTRQLAAIYLRKFVASHWKSVSPPQQQQIKQALLQKLRSETVRAARLAVAGVICSVGKLTLGRSGWPELLQTLGAMAQAGQPNEHREIAMLLFRNLMQSTRKGMGPHLATMIQVFKAGMSDSVAEVRKESLKSIAATAELVTNQKQLQELSGMVPAIVQLVQHCLKTNDDETAMIAFEMFTDLAESEQGVAVLQPHFKSLADFTMTVVGEPKLSIAVRTQAAAYIQWMLRYRSKTVTQQGLVPPLLQLALRCVIEPWPENADSTEGSPMACGCDMLDEIFLNIAKAQCFQLAMQGVQQLLQSGNLNQQRGALVCLTMMAEGCSFEMKSGKQIPEFLKVIKMAVQSEKQQNRVVAMECLQQFVLHFQPEILDYHAVIMPCVCGVANNPQESLEVKEQACTAMEAYCEYLGDKIMPYVEGVMGLLSGMVATNNRKLQSSAVSVIGSVANSAGASFVKYYENVAKMLLQMMNLREPESEALRGEATSCMGCVGSAVGKEKFALLLPSVIPLVMECLQSDSSECREHAFSFMQSFAETYGPTFITMTVGNVALFQQTLKLVLSCLDDDEGLRIVEADDGFGGKGVYTGEDDEETQLLIQEHAEEYEDLEDMARNMKYHVASGFLDEKVAAIHVLAKMCEHCGKPMLQYLEQIIQHLLFCFEYPHPAVRCAMTRAVQQSTLLLLREYPTGPWKQGVANKLHPNVEKWLLDVVPIYIQTMLTDEDDDNVAGTLDCLGALLRKAGPGVLNLKLTKDSPRALLEEIVDSILLLLREKAECQGGGEDLYDGIVDGEENDLLAETTDLISAIAEVMGPSFEPHFQKMCQVLFSRFQDGKRHFHDRSMSIGCIGDAAQYMLGGCMQKYLDTTINTALQLANKQEDTQLTQNAIFTMGAMVQSCGQGANAFLDRITTCIKQFLPIERTASKEENFVRDNAVSAIGKIYMTNSQHGPTLQCIPLFLQGLPLAVDFAENKYVYQALIHMLQNHFQQLQQHLPHIMTQLGRAFISADVKAETKRGLMAPVKQLLANQVVQAALGNIPAETRQALAQVMNS